MDPTPPPLFGTPREWAQDLTLATAMGLFLGVIGPFGSFYGGPVEARIPYWVGNMCIGFVVLTLVVRLMVRAALRFDLPVWFALATGVAAGSVPLCLALSLFSALVWPANHGHASPFLSMYGQTLAIAEPCGFLYYWLGVRKGHNPPFSAKPPAADPSEGDAPSPSPAPTAAGAAFLDRLPPRLGRELIALQMEDHYVRAHTARGSDLILTPLKDAIAELGGVEGMQVHRSWWVARAAVEGAAPNGRNLALKLKGGLSAPVSRASVAKLKAAGWLTDA